MTNKEKIFKYFEEISKIPRGSGNEREISNYLKDVAKDMGFDVIQDENLNLVINVPDTSDGRIKNTVILQGHMDMVPEKGESSTHDFLKDPIELIYDKDKLHANDTTLGADDGIGVAMALALSEEEHGPMKIIVTVSEETDMHGAKTLDPKYLDGDYLINIDSEEEGIVTVSSAGGVQFQGYFKPTLEKYEGEILNINFSGFLGGHSGMEIANNKGNMIKVMAEFLKIAKDVKIVDINSGTKDNAIPRAANLKVVMDSQRADLAIDEILIKFIDVEGKLSIKYKEEDFIGEIFTRNSTIELTDILLELPHGPRTFVNEEKKILESSSNLAIIRKVNDKYEIKDSARFAKTSISHEFVQEFKNIANKFKNLEYDFINRYPEWEYKENSHLREITKNTFKKIYGKDMVEELTHGGLECGVFYEKNNNLDIISIGPDITGAHTPKETLYIESTNRVYDHIKKILQNLD